MFESSESTARFLLGKFSNSAREGSSTLFIRADGKFSTSKIHEALTILNLNPSVIQNGIN
jgi:hypothetical protein